MRFERIVEGIAFLPQFNLIWMRDFKTGKKVYDITFAWLRWQILTTNYKKFIKDFE